MAPRLELAPELLSELAPGLVHRNVILPVPSPDLRISDPGECGRNRMIVAARIYDNDFRREGLEKIPVAGIVIAVMIGLHHSHRPADTGNLRLEIPFLRRIGRHIQIPSREVAPIVIRELPVSKPDGAGVHVLIEKIYIPAVHLPGFHPLASPHLPIGSEIAYLEVAGIRLRIVLHRELLPRAVLELLRHHPEAALMLDESEIMLDEAPVSCEDLLPGREIIVRPAPVHKLVEMDEAAHERDSGQCIPVPARQCIPHAADMVVMKMGDHRIVQRTPSRQSFHEMLHIPGLPLTRLHRTVRMLLVLGLAIVPCINHHGSAIRHNDEARVSPARRNRMYIKESLFPTGKQGNVL